MGSEKLAQAARRLWRVAIAGAIVGAIAGYASSHLAATRYEAHADVLVIPSPGTKASDALDDRLLRSYAVLLGGRRIADTVHKSTESSMSVSQVDTALTAEVLDDSTVLRVTARHTNPEIAADLSGGAADAFVDLLISSGTAADSKDADADDQDARPPLLRASVVEKSPAPSSPASPDRATWAWWGALIGLLLAFVMSTTRQVTDRRIRSAEDLSDLTGLPLIGAFGYDRAAARQDLATDLDPQHPRFEAARIMRTNLQFLDVDNASSVLTVTSCVPDEGKTTVVAQVAIALARGGQTVALVEGDLRRPRLAELFDLSSSVGLTTALIGQVDVTEAIRETSVPGLDVLTGGVRPPNPSELLQTQAMSELLTTLSRLYDVVLIDAPPLLPVTDAALLAEASDGALLVVRHGRTTQEQVRIALDRLDAVGATLYGTVLTMVPARGATKYSYGYGYTADRPSPDPTRPPTSEGRRARR